MTRTAAGALWCHHSRAEAGTGHLPPWNLFQKLPLTFMPSETREGMWCLAAPLFARLLGPGFNTDQARNKGAGAS